MRRASPSLSGPTTWNFVWSVDCGSRIVRKNGSSGSLYAQTWSMLLSRLSIVVLMLSTANEAPQKHMFLFQADSFLILAQLYLLWLHSTTLLSVYHPFFLYSLCVSPLEHSLLRHFFAGIPIASSRYLCTQRLPLTALQQCTFPSHLLSKLSRAKTWSKKGSCR